jgi:hypothetical protein
MLILLSWLLRAYSRVARDSAEGCTFTYHVFNGDGSADYLTD